MTGVTTFRLRAYSRSTFIRILADLMAERFQDAVTRYPGDMPEPTLNLPYIRLNAEDQIARGVCNWIFDDDESGADRLTWYQDLRYHQGLCVLNWKE